MTVVQVNQTKTPEGVVLHVLLDPTDLAKVKRGRRKPLTPTQVERVRQMQGRIDREVALSLKSKRETTA